MGLCVETVFVTFHLAVTKCLKRSNFQEQGLVWAYSLRRCNPTCREGPESRTGGRLVTLRLQLGSTDWTGGGSGLVVRSREASAPKGCSTFQNSTARWKSGAQTHEHPGDRSLSAEDLSWASGKVKRRNELLNVFKYLTAFGLHFGHRKLYVFFFFSFLLSVLNQGLLTCLAQRIFLL